MKHLFLTISIVLIGISMLGQDIHFPSSIVAAGGSSEGSSVNLSRWRLAPIHVITIPEDGDLLNENDADWAVIVYPNPAVDFLYLQFELPEQRELQIEVTDVSGRVIYSQEPQPFTNGSTVELNLSNYSPELYLVRVVLPDLKTQMVYKFQKL